MKRLSTSCCTFYERLPHAYSETRSLKVQPSNFQNKCLHEVICVSRQAYSAVCACECVRGLISKAVLAAMPWGESAGRAGDASTGHTSPTASPPPPNLSGSHGAASTTLSVCVCESVTVVFALRLQASSDKGSTSRREGEKAKTTTLKPFISLLTSTQSFTRHSNNCRSHTSPNKPRVGNFDIWKRAVNSRNSGRLDQKTFSEVRAGSNTSSNYKTFTVLIPVLLSDSSFKHTDFVLPQIIAVLHKSLRCYPWN